METLMRPDPRFIARQLRKPSGEFAAKIAQRMNYVNEVLYDFLIDLLELKDNEKVLEIGFGNGKFFKKLFERRNNIQVYGIDYSKEMVEEADENNSSEILSGALNIKLAGSDNIPFEQNFFDKVFCNNVIYFWEEPDKHLKEIHRVLKPGGKFFSGLKTKESTLKLPFSRYGFVIYESEEWKLILEQNGFSQISINRKLDPVIEEDGEPVQLESLCFTAEKKK
jgi:ubiquinone/menaquinone biosynthesis C-methylase UbiE